MPRTSLKHTLPMITMKGLVVFPGMVLNFDVTRPRFVEAVKTACLTDKHIFLITQVYRVVRYSPWGTFFWLRTKIACPPAPPQPRLIIHRYLRILLFDGTSTCDSMPCHRRIFFLLLITLNVTLILILRHIYIKKNWRSKPKLNKNAIKS